MKTRRRKSSAVEQTFTIVEIGDVEVDTVCRVCQAEFLDEVDLKLHVSQVHVNDANGMTVCKFCFSVLPDGDEFVSHFIFQHLDNVSFCPHCHRAFEDLQLLDQHQLKHCFVDEQTPITCSQCNSIHHNSLELQNHEYREHRNSADGVMLTGYYPLLSSALNLNITKFLNFLLKSNMFACVNCSYETRILGKYIQHLKQSQCRSFACDKCYSVYKKKCSLALHMNKNPDCQNYTVDGNDQRQCLKCESYFDANIIARHMKDCLVVKCSTCGLYFQSINHLADHRVKDHAAKVTVKICKFCKREYVGMPSLMKHMERAHKDISIYKYNCVYCDSLFSHPGKLFAHFYTIHKNINPYTCKICDKKFRIRKNFTIHIKLAHKSIGFVEFDKKLHVIFTDKKSENPVTPCAVKSNEIDTTEGSDIDNNENIKATPPPETPTKPQTTKMKTKNDLIQNDSQDSTQSDVIICPDLNTESEDNSLLKVRHDKNKKRVKIRRLDSETYLKKTVSQPKIIEVNSTESSDDELDDMPLSKVKKSHFTKNRCQNITNNNKKISDHHQGKTAKLTCKICKKYCYTIQNFHHHLSLHEKRKQKRCIKCEKYFRSKAELANHMEHSHSSSKLTETLKSLLEKRKRNQPSQSSTKPGELLKTLLEKRKRTQQMMEQNSSTNKFQRTIKKVDIVDDCVATITPVSDHGLSVKNFIENFKPDLETVNISNSVTIKTTNEPAVKEPLIKLKKFNPEPPIPSNRELKLPVKFQDTPSDMNTNVTVKLVQQLITKPKLVNMTFNEKIPLHEAKTDDSNDYCNMFADETDYTQYKNECIPEVAQEVMLQDTDDIPMTRRLEQEIMIPNIPKEHGNVKIGHLLPKAPYYKIVDVNKLMKCEVKEEPKFLETRLQLPDGTQLISVKNPYAHLLPNEHLQEILQANKNKYYKTKVNNIGSALAKALQPKETKTAPLRRVGRKPKKSVTFA